MVTEGQDSERTSRGDEASQQEAASVSKASAPRSVIEPDSVLVNQTRVHA